MDPKHEISIGNFERRRDHGQASIGQSTDNLPGVQRIKAKENRPVPFGLIFTGRGGLALLALFVQRGAVV